jgi:putative selenate reductase
MAHLRPYPFGALVDRMFRELDARRSIFDLPERRFFSGDRGKDFSVRFHDHPVASPLGPAAGPQTQMAQNLVLSWLGGCRILELKTVQIEDELEIPRPCIDMQTIGYNVEWSQELKLEQSLEEYVKGAMLIEMLRASGRLELEPGFERTVYDMSVGYDLAGIQSPRVLEFIRGMRDAGAIIGRLRSEIPSRHRRYRDLDFAPGLSDTVTLSTFHGCPPDEIERILDFLLRELGLHCIVKLNPMLLGRREVRETLHGELGYTELRVPESAFERDTKWEQAAGFVQRLRATAEELGLGFGIKLTNTLIVENHRRFFDRSQKEMYLSGPPLHVLAMKLVQRFRDRFGDRVPISFSAGIDRTNFPDAVALGLVPVTICTDFLKPGGYGRAESYHRHLSARMDAAGARRIDDFVLRARGNARKALEALVPPLPAAVRERCLRALADGTDLRTAAGDEIFRRWVSRARLLNTLAYVEGLSRDPRYAKERNAKVPRKIGSRLELFDCITCDKCIPVCPNDANFTFVFPLAEIPVVRLRATPSGWSRTSEGSLAVERPRQIGNFADFCNDCGNCDIFCPEDGGPYLIKPRFFGSLESWRAQRTLDGFCFSRSRAGTGVRTRAGRRTVTGAGSKTSAETESVTSAEMGITIRGRFGRREYTVEPTDRGLRYSGPGFTVEVDGPGAETVLGGEATVEVDLTYLHIMLGLARGVLADGEVNYLSGLLPGEE